MMKKTLSLIALTLCAAQLCAGQSLKFNLCTDKTADGYMQVAAGDFYSDDIGYGYEKGGDGAPASFSVKLPEGSYKVSVTLGDPEGTSKTSIRAEQRRLVLEGCTTSKGEIVRKSFSVNVRSNTLSPGNTLKLDSREWDYGSGQPLAFNWDDKLTLTFCDENPKVRTVEIEPLERPLTVYLIGDSTVTDQAGSYYGTWGQVLPLWFKLPVVVANHAESGQTLKAFRFQRRWDKVYENLKAGDYVLIQLGTNDSKAKGHDGMWPKDDMAGEWEFTHSDAGTDYVWQLATYAVEIMRKGAIPVIVSPMTKVDLNSCTPDASGLIDRYAEGAKKAAELVGCTYVDLFSMSKDIVKALGPDTAKAYQDGTHSGNFGGYLFSRCIAKGIKDSGLGLADHLIDGAADFNPAAPLPLLKDFNTAADNSLPRPRPSGR